ncbi:MAG: hypothetical protein WA884_00165 [Methyloceanibacter sp.]
MRLIGFDKYEYQLIGEIAVLSGMIEQQMKELIVKLVGAPWLDGIAIVAHQNFGSLCDIASSLLPSTVPSPGYSKVFALQLRTPRLDMMREANWFTVHSLSLQGISKSTLRFMARGQIKYQGFQFDRSSLKEILAGLIDVHGHLFGCALLLEEERGESNLEHLRPRSRRATQKANPRKR